MRITDQIKESKNFLGIFLAIISAVKRRFLAIVNNNIKMMQVWIIYELNGQVFLARNILPPSGSPNKKIKVFI